MIFNNDQGSQFTSDAFTNRLQAANVAISWDSRGSYFDNIFIERLWRSVKYEEVYLNDYDSVTTAWHRLRDYFNFYNQQRFTNRLIIERPTRSISNNFWRIKLTRLPQILHLKSVALLSKGWG